MGVSKERDLFTLIATEVASEQNAFAQDVKAGLTADRKWLSCRFFYDGEGAQLFETICDLPEYYLTRAEREILEAQAGEIVSGVPKGASLVELGSGSAAKTRLLIEAFLKRQGELQFVPVDISRAMLRESSLALLEDYAGLEVLAVASEYRAGLARVKAEVEGPKLILWLGSSVGNLDRTEAAGFLGRVRETMAARDRLLLGVDLRKEKAVLEAAYDDAQGVTARFNLNLLVRINRELGGRFDLERFRHRAVYDGAEGRVGMYLVSLCDQTVPIEGLSLEVPFAEGEAIHTENSYKYSTAEIEALADVGGLAVERQWFDARERFSLNLLKGEM